jgi:hypothetical protein
MESILNQSISFYQNVFDKAPGEINLREALLSPQWKDQVEFVRSIQEEPRQKVEKGKLPLFTIGGLFSAGDDASLLRPTGLMGIDIDAGDNEGIPNFHQFKELIRAAGLPFVAYCGLSIRGKGFFLVIAIEDPTQYSRHHAQMEADFAKNGLKIDPSCKNISRKRFVTFDPEPYINDNAIPVKLRMPKPETYRPRVFAPRTGTKDAADILTATINRAQDGNKHETLLKAARLAGGYIAGNQITEAEAVAILEEAIRCKTVVSFADAQKTIQKGIAYGKREPIYR